MPSKGAQSKPATTEAGDNMDECGQPCQVEGCSGTCVKLPVHKHMESIDAQDTHTRKRKGRSKTTYAYVGPMRQARVKWGKQRWIPTMTVGAVAHLDITGTAKEVTI